MLKVYERPQRGPVRDRGNIQFAAEAGLTRCAGDGIGVVSHVLGRFSSVPHRAGRSACAKIALPFLLSLPFSPSQSFLPFLPLPRFRGVIPEGALCASKGPLYISACARLVHFGLCVWDRLRPRTSDIGSSPRPLRASDPRASFPAPLQHGQEAPLPAPQFRPYVGRRNSKDPDGVARASLAAPPSRGCFRYARPLSCSF